MEKIVHKAPPGQIRVIIVNGEEGGDDWVSGDFDNKEQASKHVKEANEKCLAGDFGHLGHPRLLTKMIDDQGIEIYL